MSLIGWWIDTPGNPKHVETVSWERLDEALVRKVFNYYASKMYHVSLGLGESEWAMLMLISYIVEYATQNCGQRWQMGSGEPEGVLPWWPPMQNQRCGVRSKRERRRIFSWPLENDGKP